MSSLNISVPDSVYQSIQEIIQDSETSVEEFISTAITEKIAILKSQSYLKERGNRGSRVKYEAILKKVPDLEPLTQDISYSSSILPLLPNDCFMTIFLQTVILNFLLPMMQRQNLQNNTYMF